MENHRLVKISKYLSKHLRHQPERIGIKISSGGWVAVDELLVACSNHSFPITCDELNEVVATNDKKRFSFDSTGKLIRASQGHSIDVDLQLQAQIPPDVLYHGTGADAVESILSTGICQMSRHHVHLSTDVATAKAVGKRHGIPVVFTVDAARMYQDNFKFYCSDNGVWLVERIPPEYIQKI